MKQTCMRPAQLLRLLCLLLVLPLSACASQLMPAASPTPRPALTPEPVPTPAPENPLEAFFSPFAEAYAPLLAAFEQAQQADITALDESIAFETHILRLQLFFLPFTELLAGTEAGSWDGILFGADGGTGTITEHNGQVTFTAALASPTSITGTLAGDTLSARWETEDGQTRTASLTRTADGYFSAVEWNGARTACLLAGDALYYGRGVAEDASAQNAAQWAAWRLIDGRVERMAASPSSIGGSTG